MSIFQYPRPILKGGYPTILLNFSVSSRIHSCYPIPPDMHCRDDKDIESIKKKTLTFHAGLGPKIHFGILTTSEVSAMFNSLMPSLNSRSLPFVVFLGGFPSRCQNLVKYFKLYNGDFNIRNINVTTLFPAKLHNQSKTTSLFHKLYIK